MSELRDLYQEVIVDHSKQPRNFRKLDSANRKAEGFNPLCGDKVTVYLTLENGRVTDVSFQGSGCAISMASASMMTEALKNKTEAEAEALFKGFHDLVTMDPDRTEEQAEAAGENLGKLAVFSGVCEFPARVKCASLAWHTVHNALHGDAHTASTE